MPAFAYRFERTHTAAEALAAYRDEMGDDGPAVAVAGRIVSLRSQGKTTFLHLEDGQRPDPALSPPRRSWATPTSCSSGSTSTTTSACTGGCSAPGRARSRCARRIRRATATRPAPGPTPARAAGQVPAAAPAREDPHGRRRAPPPSAASRTRRCATASATPTSRCTRRCARCSGSARRGDQLDPPVPRRPGVPRGRDPDPPAALRRRRGAAVRDPPQRARHAALPADRRRALPQAAAGRRARAGLRDRPRLPERGDGSHAQPRVHHARGLPGLRRLRRHDEPGGGPRVAAWSSTAWAPAARALRHHARLHAAVRAGCRSSRASASAAGSTSAPPPTPTMRAVLAPRGADADEVAGARRRPAAGRGVQDGAGADAGAADLRARLSRRRSRRWPRSTAPIRRSPSGSSCSSAAGSWPTRSASSTIRTTSGGGSRTRSRQKAAGNDEAQPYDADFIRALEYGMPPAGGVGSRHRPADHADRRPAVHPRRHSLPGDAAGGVDGRRAERRARRCLVDPSLADPARVAAGPALSPEPADVERRLAQHRDLDRRRGGRGHGADRGARA